MTQELLAQVIEMYVEHILKSVDEKNSKDTKSFQAGVAEGINNMVIDCFFDDYPAFRDETERLLDGHGYTRYGISLVFLREVTA